MLRTWFPDRPCSLPLPRADRRLRVLIVEDDPDTARSLAILVRRWGHEFGVALDGRFALHLATDFRPHVALIDIALPGMDGYDVARRLQAALRDVRCIAVSGYSREEGERR